MSKFNVKIDENGNVSNVEFPKTNVSVGIKYSESSDNGESLKPSSVILAGQNMSINKFSEVKMEKDEQGKLTFGGGIKKPWWWDLFFKNFYK